jgi:hypothetical protein
MKVTASVTDTTTGVLTGRPVLMVSMVGPQGAPGALDADTPVDRLGFIDRTTGDTHYIFFDQGQMGKES